jgi:hypothetical protein
MGSVDECALPSCNATGHEEGIGGRMHTPIMYATGHEVGTCCGHGGRNMRWVAAAVTKGRRRRPSFAGGGRDGRVLLEVVPPVSLSRKNTRVPSINNNINAVVRSGVEACVRHDHSHEQPEIEHDSCRIAISSGAVLLLVTIGFVAILNPRLLPLYPTKADPPYVAVHLV